MQLRLGGVTELVTCGEFQSQVDPAAKVLGTDMQPTSRDDCRKAIVRVLTSDEASFLRRLFALAKREPPQCKKIGIVSLSETPQCGSCPSMFSWGHTHYCAHADAILNDTAPWGGRDRKT